MDPDPEAEQAASKILRTGFITIVFTACNSYQTETTASVSVSNIQFSLPDSTVKTTTGVITPKKKKKKTLYLTFDDGPNKGTRKVMNIVKEEEVPVTMFLVGEHVFSSSTQTATYDSLLECSGLIELENHSYSHAQNRYEKFYSVPDSVAKDFIRCADSLHLRDNIIRTPGRNIWRTKTVSATDIKKSTAAADSLQQQGFTIIGWDLEWGFDKELKLKCSDEELLKQLDSVFAKGKTKTLDHLVLLAHDQVYEDATDSCMLHNFFKKLKIADEYNFEVISSYPGIKN